MPPDQTIPSNEEPNFFYRFDSLSAVEHLNWLFRQRNREQEKGGSLSTNLGSYSLKLTAMNACALP